MSTYAFSSMVAQAYMSNNRFLAKNDLGMVTRNSEGDLVHIDTRKIVEVSKENVKTPWTIIGLSNKEYVLKLVSEGQTALVFADEKTDNFLYYKGVKKGDKPMFYVSQDNTHWEPESNPVNDIIHGVWYLI